MDRTTAASKIETAFRKQTRKDEKVTNAYLLVHSDELGIDLRLAEGKTGSVEANTAQPLYLASVGKLFTATLVSMLTERGDLSFRDPISSYLDPELMDGLHVYKGQEYSDEIEIRHLLNQSSGLYDAFWPLLQKMIEDPTLRFTPREAVMWGKEHLKPEGKPGQKHHYTDTNYWLLGMIVESVTGKAFHEALHGHIFEPLGMERAYMQGYSEPAVESEDPVASFTIDGVDGTTIPGLPGIDYAGGGVIAPLDDYLTFMQALVNHRLVNADTLERMRSDDYRSYPTIRYGYGIWKFVTIPLILPKKYYSWGCAGATGAFMFYHPRTESHIIGTFNDASYMSKGLQWMLSKVVRQLPNVE
jgi:D-alanyl-D-alanine carboxypeptidase